MARIDPALVLVRLTGSSNSGGSACCGVGRARCYLPCQHAVCGSVKERKESTYDTRMVARLLHRWLEGLVHASVAAASRTPDLHDSSQVAALVVAPDVRLQAPRLADDIFQAASAIAVILVSASTVWG